MKTMMPQVYALVSLTITHSKTINLQLTSRFKDRKLTFDRLMERFSKFVCLGGTGA